MGLFSKPKQPGPPPGMQQKSNGHTSYLTTDPGPHTCTFPRGQQISATTVRLECDQCEATKDVYSPDPGN